MRLPAQTHLELLAQVQQSGIADDQLRRLRDAYLFAMRLYASVYTGGGKPTILHEVGTASLALHYGADFEVVLAGLMHGAYWVGDWGRHRRGPTRATRALLREAVGERAESIVYRLYRLDWHPADVATLASRTTPFDREQRDAIFLKLLDLLEHILDLGALLFFRDVEQVRAEMRAERDDLRRLAEIIGPPAFAADFDQAVERALDAELPPLLVGVGAPGEGLNISPLSCRTRLSLRLYWGFADGVRRIARSFRAGLKA